MSLPHESPGPVPRPLFGLRLLLVGLTVTLILGAVAAVSWAALATFGHLGEEAAARRLELATTRAERAIVAQADELVRTARLLAERPTLRRMVLQGDPAVGTFLTRFAETGGLVAAAVLVPEGAPNEPSADPHAPWSVLAEGGNLSLGAVVTTQATSLVGHDRHLVHHGEHLLLLAAAPLADDPTRRAVVAIELDDRWLGELATAIGAHVALLAPAIGAAPSGPDPWHPGADLPIAVSDDDGRLVLRRPLQLGTHTLAPPATSGAAGAPSASDPGAADADPLPPSDPRAATAGLEGKRTDARESTASATPASASPAATDLELVVSLPASAAREGMDAFAARLRRLAFGVALLAGILALAAGEALARPVAALTAAAARIGRGDLASPVAVPAPTAGRDLTLLAGEMDAMRRRLRTAHATLAEREAESRAILGGIAEGVFTVDSERRITFLNPQAASVLGLSPAPAGGALADASPRSRGAKGGGEELAPKPIASITMETAIGRFCGDVLAPRRADGTRPCEDDCPILHARSRGATRAIEHLAGPHGRRTVVITSAPPAASPDEDPAAGSGRQIQLLRDETREESDARLRETVLAHLSHELETPLAAQLASLELLRDQLERDATDAAAHGEITGDAGTKSRTKFGTMLGTNPWTNPGTKLDTAIDTPMDHAIEPAIGAATAPSIGTATAGTATAGPVGDPPARREPAERAGGSPAGDVDHRDERSHRTRDQLALVGALERGTLRLAQLVHNLLERARIEAGEASIRHQPVELDAVIEEAVEAVRPLFAQRGQTLEVELPYPLPVLVGDAQRLAQVFVNLLANAQKFAPERSTVRVGGNVADDAVSLWVEDQGPGLPPALAGEVFRPFVRLPGRGPGEGGIGLGLAIVDSIVRRHGGRVRVESPPPGTGAAGVPGPAGRQDPAGSAPPAISAPSPGSATLPGSAPSTALADPAAPAPRAAPPGSGDPTDPTAPAGSTGSAGSTTGTLPGTRISVILPRSGDPPA